jgi:hypothetical protein
MRVREKAAARYVDPRDIPKKVPEPNTVWAGMSRRGIVLEVLPKSVMFQAIFDGGLDVQEIKTKEFLEEYVNTPLVSADTLWDVHRMYAAAATATVKARTSLSAYFNSSQEMFDMAAAKKSPKPVAKKAAPVAEKSTKKAAPVAEKSGPGRKSAFSDDMKITVVAKENPKRAKAAERFALYKNGMTIGEYVKAGGTVADIRWDVKQNFISVK